MITDEDVVDFEETPQQFLGPTLTDDVEYVTPQNDLHVSSELYIQCCPQKTEVDRCLISPTQNSTRFELTIPMHLSRD